MRVDATAASERKQRKENQKQAQNGTKEHGCDELISQIAEKFARLSLDDEAEMSGGKARDAKEKGLKRKGRRDE